MLRVPEGSNVSEELISLTFVAPFDPGDRDKHYAVRRHLGDSGSTACILSRHHFDQLRKLHGTRLRRVGQRDLHQLRFGGRHYDVLGVAVLTFTIELGWQPSW